MILYRQYRQYRQNRRTIMTTRIRANIQVGANWEEFKTRCKLNGQTATEVINACINSYLASSETIASQAPQGFIDNRTREIVRQELPPSLKAVAESVRASLLSEIEQLKSDLAQIRHLDQTSVEPTESNPSTSNIIKNSHTEPFHNSKNQSENSLVSQSKCDTIFLVDKSEGEKDIQVSYSGEQEANEINRHLKNSTLPPAISSRTLAKILGVNGSTVSRWRIRWANGKCYNLAVEHGYEPDVRGGWSEK
jgi:hypothetical protein